MPMSMNASRQDGSHYHRRQIVYIELAILRELATGFPHRSPLWKRGLGGFSKSYVSSEYPVILLRGSFIPETAVGSQGSAQALGAPISYTSFLRPTSVSRIIVLRGGKISHCLVLILSRGTIPPCLIWPRPKFPLIA